MKILIRPSSLHFELFLAKSLKRNTHSHIYRGIKPDQVVSLVFKAAPAAQNLRRWTQMHLISMRCGTSLSKVKYVCNCIHATVVSRPWVNRQGSCQALYRCFSAVLAVLSISLPGSVQLQRGEAKPKGCSEAPKGGSVNFALDALRAQLC